MQYQGVLTKMQTEFGNPIDYYLVFENSFLHLNQLLNKSLEIEFVGYQCLNCGKKKKIFRQGFCYDCFTSSASAGDWIMKPELSTAHNYIDNNLSSIKYQIIFYLYLFLLCDLGSYEWEQIHLIYVQPYYRLQKLG